MAKFSIKIKKDKPIIKEEDTEQTTNAASDNKNDAQISQLCIQKAGLQKQIADAEAQFASKKKSLTDQIVAIDQQLAKLGAPATNESAVIKIVEAVDYKNIKEVYGKQKELATLLKDAFNNIDLSYSPTDSQMNKFCENMARGILRYVNDNSFAIGDGVDHTEDMKQCIVDYFNRGVANYSEKEKENIVDAIQDVLTKTSNSFSWLYGKIVK